MSGFGVGAKYGIGTDDSDIPAIPTGSATAPSSRTLWDDIRDGLGVAKDIFGRGGLLDDYIFTDQEKAIVEKGGIYNPQPAMPGIPGMPGLPGYNQGGSPDWLTLGVVAVGAGLLVFLIARR